MDLGCGSGYLANAIKEILPSVNIVGLDIAIKEAKIKYPELRFVKSDAEIFKLKTKFDVIVSYGVLEHLSDPFKGVLQVSSHLKPNGKIAMLMPTIPYYRSDRYDEGYYEDLNIPPQMQWNFERVKWEVMFEKAGIELYSINFSEKYGAIKPGNFYFGVKS